ncbi:MULTISPECIES: carbohydrate ABC transporter permease [Paenibacillus]|uniref:Binding-protein-dependent transport systems inner membrane component n=1 Tax=Paenibacillus lactis 154 TaxID=743719 RepID=G4HKQ7_9BACL|nr:sugar ABC transporter permease [Paenibacillus lactis]EHB59597.1 binding-protein-dependent transport systems inner membrane component [Paenibacillus lactis 154]MCM3496639.1 sugar ABC transporter permease [Paenibacillus lactis]GIO94807.1 ABC transporter permease [Paenibacillus lactis]
MYSKRTAALMQQLVYIGPALLFFGITIIIPFVMGMYYSFTNWNGVSGNVEWVGLDNFIKIFTSDRAFADSFWFTTKFTIVGVILTNLVGFFLAYFLTKKIRGRNFLRTIFFMPNVIGGLLLGFIWQFIFIKGFATLGDVTGLAFFQLPWLGDEVTGFWGIILVFVWQSSGYLMIIYIASITNVSKEVLEAAEIDGANRFQVLKNIMVPLIMPAVTVCLFLAISWSFKMFDLNLSLTKGGPYGSTESLAMNVYNEAFLNNRYGLGTAKSLIFFIVVAVITLIQVRLTKNKEVEA